MKNSPGAEKSGPAPFVPPPGNPRFPLVDSVRGIAALAVVAVHAVIQTEAYGTAWGTVIGHLGFALPLLFIVSGFVMYRPFCAHRWDAAPRVGLGTYARKRALRIFPAYWLALTVLLIYPGLPDVSGSNWWLYYGLAQVYTPETALGGLGVAWTLNVELAFYLALPLYALALDRWTAGKSLASATRHELAVFGCIVAASLAFLATIDPDGENAHLALTPLANMDWLAIGMALAVVSISWERGSRPPVLEALMRRPALAWALAVLAFVALLQIPDLPPKEEFPPPMTRASVVLEHALKGAIAFLIFLPVVLDQHAGGAVRRLLGFKVLAAAGVISYGIYLWHQPILGELIEQGLIERFSGTPFLLVTVVTLALTATLAVTSYIGLERPLLRLKFSRRQRGETAQIAPARAR
jgi:peptidoglycan/LPS O-acetylase OafA/YrhL